MAGRVAALPQVVQVSAWRCQRCGVSNEGARACEHCGRPKAAAKRVVSKAPLAVVPQYALLTSEDRAQIEVERARIKALFAPVHVGPPTIAPEVRAEVARRARLSNRVEPPDLADLDASW